MSINDATGVSPFRQVAAGLREQISSGKYSPGDRLPSARDLAEEFKVALTTAVSAYDELRQEGIVETRRGLGSFVKSVPILFRKGADRYRRHPEGLAPNRDESQAGGWTDEVTSFCWVDHATPEIAARLGIDPGDDVSAVTYTWTVDGRPIQVSTQYEPLAITRGTPIEEPVDGTRGNPGVIARFDSIGLYVDRVEEETWTRMPTKNESKLLQLGSGTPVFSIKRTHWAGDQAVETANIVIRGDRMVITTTHRVPRVEGK